MRQLAKVVVIGVVLGLLAYVSITQRDHQAAAATLTIPNTFSSGGVIYASQMNQNFNAIRDVVNALDDANVTNGSITGSLKLVNLSVTLAKMAADSVDSSKILDGTIATGDLADSSVNSAKIADGTILNNDIATGVINEDKLNIASAPTTGRLLYWNGTALDYFTLVKDCSSIITVYTTIPNFGFSRTYYASFAIPDTALDTNEANIRGWVYPKALSIGSMFVKIDDGATLTNSSTFTIKIRQSSDTTATCTIAGGAGQCSVNPTLVQNAAGTYITLRIDAGAQTGAKGLSVGVCMTPY